VSVNDHASLLRLVCKSIPKEPRSLHPNVGRQPKSHRVPVWSNTVHQWLRWKSTLTSPQFSAPHVVEDDRRLVFVPTTTRRPATTFRSLFIDSVRLLGNQQSHPIPKNCSIEECFDEPWTLGKLQGLARGGDGRHGTLSLQRRLHRLAGAEQNPRPKEMPIRTASRDGHPGRPCLSPLSHVLSLCEAPHRLFVGMLGGFVDWTF
jgi:hypothetical protein